MKIKFSQILVSLTIVFASLLSVDSFAQDEGPFPSELQDASHQELNFNAEDKTLIYENDSKSGKNTSSETHQNSVPVPVKAKNMDTHKPPALVPNNSNTKNEEDALSFNFLFYIIQKYKFSDIINQ